MGSRQHSHRWGTSCGGNVNASLSADFHLRKCNPLFQLMSKLKWEKNISFWSHSIQYTNTTTPTSTIKSGTRHGLRSPSNCGWYLLLNMIWWSRKDMLWFSVHRIGGKQLLFWHWKNRNILIKRVKCSALSWTPKSRLLWKPQKGSNKMWNWNIFSLLFFTVANHNNGLKGLKLRNVQEYIQIVETIFWQAQHIC